MQKLPECLLALFVAEAGIGEGAGGGKGETSLIRPVLPGSKVLSFLIGNDSVYSGVQLVAGH